MTAKSILFGVLQHSGIELSAHQTIESEQDHWCSFAQLAAEYLTIAAEAQRDRWITELSTSGLTDEQVDEVITSDSFGPLAAELRRAESSGFNITKVLPKIVGQRSLEDAEDIGAVLISRLRHTTQRARRISTRRANLIAGLVPVADGPMSDDMRQALTERQELMEARATAQAEAAVATKQPWLRKLGPAPSDERQREHWMREVRVVAAYRDLYEIEGHSPVSSCGGSDRQRIDEARARQAIRRAPDIAEESSARSRSGLSVEAPILG